MVKNPSNAGDAGSILGQGTKIPHEMRPPPPKKNSWHAVQRKHTIFLKH